MHTYKKQKHPKSKPLPTTEGAIQFHHVQQLRSVGSMNILPATCWCYSEPWHCLATSSRPVVTFPTLMAYFQLKPYIFHDLAIEPQTLESLITAILYQHMKSMNYKIHKNCYKALYLIFLIIKCHQNNYDYAICVAPLYCYTIDSMSCISPNS